MAENRKNFKSKKRLRYDRIIAAVFVLFIFIFIINFLISHISGTNESETSEGKQPNNVVNQVGKIEYEKKFYKYDDIHNGPLILVNENNKYIFSAEKEKELIILDDLKNDYYSIKSLDFKMNSMAAKAFNSMMSGFYQEYSDKSIMISCAFISESRQNVMYNQALDNSLTVSKGGYSEHQTGLAVDISTCSSNGNVIKFNPIGKYEWIKKNCDKYGFIRRYIDSKSSVTGISGHGDHFRYVGIPHAYYMTENNLTLEEYITELKNYSYGQNTLNISCYSKDYEVYYIKAKSDNEDGNVDVYVPCVNNYTISGNNIDGFIITVEK